MTPSRDFMIQQAVLNALNNELGPTVQYDGVAYAAQWLLDQPARLGLSKPVADYWLNIIHREYRAIASRYSSDTLRSIGGSVG